MRVFSQSSFMVERCARCGFNSAGDNSWFGAFNSRLGRFKFPFLPLRTATGIAWQPADSAHCFCDQTARIPAKSKKFPVPRELPGISPYADRNRLVMGGNGDGTQRQSSDHRSDLGNSRALAHEAASVLSRLWRRQIAIEGARALSSAALSFRVAGAGKLRDALCARLSLRGRAQDDRRE